jgi:hypothetical protein
VSADVVLETLRESQTLLSQLGARYAVVGGLALQGWGRVRQTKDVDLLVQVAGKTPEEILAAGRSLGFVPDPKHPTVTLGRATVVRFIREEPRYGLSIRVDLLLAVDPFHAGVIERAALRTVLGLTIPLASCEDLVMMKLAAGRPIDLVDADELLAVNAPGIDRQALRARATQLGLLEDLAAAAARAGIELS